MAALPLWGFVCGENCGDADSEWELVLEIEKKGLVPFRYLCVPAAAKNWREKAREGEHGSAWLYSLR